MVQLHSPSLQPQADSTEKQGNTSQVVMTSLAFAAGTQTSREQPAMAQSASLVHSPAVWVASTRCMQALYRLAASWGVGVSAVGTSVPVAGTTVVSARF
jgi:hypothetical protein